MWIYVWLLQKKSQSYSWLYDLWFLLQEVPVKCTQNDDCEVKRREHVWCTEVALHEG
jgi:hypothetical protein